MKQLTALLCTIVLTFTLCVSIASAEAILIKPTLMLTSNNNTVYSFDENSAGLIYVNSLPKLVPADIRFEDQRNTFGFAEEKVISEHNYFFEFSIIFNDKLQQLIAFFTRDDDEHSVHEKVGNNSFSDKTLTQECSTIGKS